MTLANDVSNHDFTSSLCARSMSTPLSSCWCQCLAVICKGRCSLCAHYTMAVATSRANYHARRQGRTERRGRKASALSVSRRGESTVSTLTVPGDRGSAGSPQDSRWVASGAAPTARLCQTHCKSAESPLCQLAAGRRAITWIDSSRPPYSFVACNCYPSPSELTSSATPRYPSLATRILCTMRDLAVQL